MKETIRLSKHWKHCGEGFERTFMMHERYRSKTVCMDFPHFSHGISVEINGIPVVSSVITEYIIFGEQNTIFVSGDIESPNDGVLECCPDIIIEESVTFEENGVFTVTGEEKDGVQQLMLCAEVKNTGYTARRTKVLFTVRSDRGKLMRKCAAYVTVPAQRTMCAEAKTAVTVPARWGTDDPSLCSVTAELYDDKALLDSTVQSFGFREVPHEHKPRYAVCAGFGSGASPLSSLSAAAVLEQVRCMGFFRVCTELSDMSEEYLDMCDTLGVEVICLVRSGIGETTDTNRLRLCRRHVCVLSYIIECTEDEADARSLTVVARLLSDISTTDGTRPVAYFVNDVVTPLSFPKNMCAVYTTEQADRILREHRSREVIICTPMTATPACNAAVIDKARVQKRIYAAVMLYSCKAVSDAVFSAHPWLWCRLNYRELYETLRCCLAKMPSVYLYAESKGSLLLHLFTNCESAALSLSGIPLQIKKKPNSSHAVTRCGEIPEYTEAVGFCEGKEAARYVLDVSGDACALSAVAVMADRDILILMSVFRDSEGRACMHGAQKVRVRCEGRAAPVYSGSVCSFGRENGGEATGTVAVVRLIGPSGQGKVIFSAEGFPDAAYLI